MSLRHLDHDNYPDGIKIFDPFGESGTLGTLSAVAEAIYGCLVETRRPYSGDYTVSNFHMKLYDFILHLAVFLVKQKSFPHLLFIHRSKSLSFSVEFMRGQAPRFLLGFFISCLRIARTRAERFQRAQSYLPLAPAPPEGKQVLAFPIYASEDLLSKQL